MRPWHLCGHELSNELDIETGVEADAEASGAEAYARGAASKWR
jgi:hypothetical protein